MTSPATPTPPKPGSATRAVPAPATSSARLPADTVKALQLALAAEQVAVWAYDLVAAYDAADSDLVATIRAGHLTRQGATAGLLISGGSSAPSPAAAYALPRAVTDVPSARALSATIEADCAQAWRGVIGATDSTSIRAAGLAGLSDSAVWLTQLKLAAKTNPATMPFPGQA